VCSSDLGRNPYTTIPATDAAKQWDGWGTALKPAWEPIVLARKPFNGTVAKNVQEHGTGAMNIDGCRVGTDDSLGGGATKGKTVCSHNGEAWDRPWKHNDDARESHASRVRDNVVKAEMLGRWPANLILDGEAGAILDESVKESPSRFFYCPKTNKKERNLNGCDNRHPTVKPTELMRYLVRLITPPNGIVLDPFCGSGSTGLACQRENMRFIGFDKDIESVQWARKRMGID